MDGDGGYSDVGFASLDGILMESGVDLGTWTCAADEVEQVGVRIDSNGMTIDTNKIHVDGDDGECLYADADRTLTFVGNHLSQSRDAETGEVREQLAIGPGYSTMNLVFQKANDALLTVGARNDRLQTVGTIGFGNRDDLSEPMYFRSDGGFEFNGARPLISDPKRIPENGTISNHLMDAGWYYNESSPQAATITGVPEATAFMLRVEDFAHTGIKIQTFTPWNGSCFYKRSYQSWTDSDGNGPGWRPWYKYTGTLVPY